jgi:MSHA biogenesis protein MshJ
MSTANLFHQQWGQAVDFIDVRPLRERVLMLITISAMFIFIFYMALFNPLWKAHATSQQLLNVKQAEITSLQVETQIFEDLLRQSDEDTKRTRLERLRKMVQDVEVLSEFMEGLIDPKEMARLVDRILASNKRLEVIRVNNIPATIVWPEPREPEMSDDPSRELEMKKDELTIYKHDVLVEVKGSYHDIVRFVARLESMPWKVLWESVKLTTDESAEPTVSLMIYTLSVDKAWIGL